MSLARGIVHRETENRCRVGTISELRVYEQPWLADPLAYGYLECSPYTFIRVCTFPIRDHLVLDLGSFDAAAAPHAHHTERDIAAGRWKLLSLPPWPRDLKREREVWSRGAGSVRLAGRPS